MSVNLEEPPALNTTIDFLLLFRTNSESLHILRCIKDWVHCIAGSLSYIYKTKYLDNYRTLFMGQFSYDSSALIASKEPLN